MGLSPRGRGKPAGHWHCRVCGGSIPAWAGETTRYTATLTVTEVYPRVGGGNVSHPHQHRGGWGLSPRGRGKRLGAGLPGLRRRSIPAWAGETWDCGGEILPSEVYPRVGGGNQGLKQPLHLRQGLSPRGRGKPAPAMLWRRRKGSIPAWAGETPAGHGRASAGGVYPRVGGGNGSGGVCCCIPRGLSPRGRGKPTPPAASAARPRSIPAWAGETHGRSPPRRSPGVYPRVGGGNPGG